jgi:hypothetical protein
MTPFSPLCRHSSLTKSPQAHKIADHFSTQTHNKIGFVSSSINLLRCSSVINRQISSTRLNPHNKEEGFKKPHFNKINDSVDSTSNSDFVFNKNTASNNLNTYVSVSSVKSENSAANNTPNPCLDCEAKVPEKFNLKDPSTSLYLNSEVLRFELTTKLEKEKRNLRLNNLKSLYKSRSFYNYFLTTNNLINSTDASNPSLLCSATTELIKTSPSNSSSNANTNTNINTNAKAKAAYNFKVEVAKDKLNNKEKDWQNLWINKFNKITTSICLFTNKRSDGRRSFSPGSEPNTSDKLLISYLKQRKLDILNKHTFNTFLASTKEINYSFNTGKRNTIRKVTLRSLYNLLKSFFESLNSLISYPILNISPNKLKINLFYYVKPTRAKIKEHKKYQKYIRNAGILFKDNLLRSKLNKLKHRFNVVVFLNKWLLLLNTLSTQTQILLRPSMQRQPNYLNIYPKINEITSPILTLLTQTRSGDQSPLINTTKEDPFILSLFNNILKLKMPTNNANNANNANDTNNANNADSEIKEQVVVNKFKNPTEVVEIISKVSKSKVQELNSNEASLPQQSNSLSVSSKTRIGAFKLSNTKQIKELISYVSSTSRIKDEDLAFPAKPKSNSSSLLTKVSSHTSNPRQLEFKQLELDLINKLNSWGDTFLRLHQIIRLVSQLKAYKISKINKAKESAEKISQINKAKESATMLDNNKTKNNDKQIELNYADLKDKLALGLIPKGLQTPLLLKLLPNNELDLEEIINLKLANLEKLVNLLDSSLYLPEAVDFKLTYNSDDKLKAVSGDSNVSNLMSLEKLYTTLISLNCEDMRMSPKNYRLESSLFFVRMMPDQRSSTGLFKKPLTLSAKKEVLLRTRQGLKDILILLTEQECELLERPMIINNINPYANKNVILLIINTLHELYRDTLRLSFSVMSTLSFTGKDTGFNNQHLLEQADTKMKLAPNHRSSVAQKEIPTIVSLNLYKFKFLIYFLEKLFNKPLELNLTRLKYPYHESNILAQVLALSSNKERAKFFLIMKNLLYTASIKHPGKSTVTQLDTFKNIPSYLSGLKVRLAGRLLTERLVPRKTVKTFQVGSLAKGKVNFKTTSRLTLKNKRGAYSFTVTTSHILANSSKKSKQ